jgi:hypothetical protein
MMWNTYDGTIITSTAGVRLIAVWAMIASVSDVAITTADVDAALFKRAVCSNRAGDCQVRQGSGEDCEIEELHLGREIVLF